MTMDALADIALYEQGLACPIWRGYYDIRMTGQVYSRGEPPQAIFEQAWAYMLRLHDNMPRILGNLLAHSTERWGETYTEALMQATGNPRAIFLHCLPAVKGEEVTAEVIDGEQSAAWEQAENRKHTIKALMLATLSL